MNFTIHKDEFREDTQFNRQSLQTLYFAYKPFQGRILMILVLGFVARIIILSNTNVIGYWVDSYCINNCRPLPSFFKNFGNMQYIGLLLILSTIGFIATLVFRILFSRLSATAVSQIYDEVTWRTSRFPMTFFDKTPAGRIITRFSSDYGNIFRLFGGPLAEFFSILFDLISMVFLITLASPYYLIFVIGISGVYLAIYLLNRKSLRKARRELSASRSPSVAHFAETTQGAAIIRIFNQSRSFEQRFTLLDQFYLDQKIQTVRKISLFSFEMNGLSAFLLLMTGLGAHHLVQTQQVSVGSVGVAFGFIALSGNTIQMFFEWLTQLEDALVGVERLDNYLRRPIEEGSFLPAQVQFETDHPKYTPDQEQKQEQELKNKINLKGTKAARVDFIDLSFRYAESSPWIFKDLSFSIESGEKLGIVGRTGSGKSTLISNLFYLYPLERGFISIDHKIPNHLLLRNDPQSEGPPQFSHLEGMDLLNFRKSIALIPQDPVLFLGSLRQNLDFQNNFSDEELYHVLEQVGLKAWTMAHPKKLHISIEERGKNLSLGERQLVCMARCLLQDSPVVVMDEATSSVDPQSEEIMVRATEEFFIGRTQLIIAHRLSTLKKCDRILWLKNGKIHRWGPTSEVLPEFTQT